jgi:hypothetical protein
MVVNHIPCYSGFVVSENCVTFLRSGVITIMVLRDAVFWVVTACSLKRARYFGKNIAPPSSEAKSKPSKKLTVNKP